MFLYYVFWLRITFKSKDFCSAKFRPRACLVKTLPLTFRNCLLIKQKARTPNTTAVTTNVAPMAEEINLASVTKERRYLKTEASWRSISEMDHDNKPVLVRQTNHTARSIAKAFLFVFHVKYLRSSAIARNTFTSSTNMQTTLTRINKWDRNSEIIAEVFPLNHLTFSTPQST